MRAFAADKSGSSERAYSNDPQTGIGIRKGRHSGIPSSWAHLMHRCNKQVRVVPVSDACDDGVTVRLQCAPSIRHVGRLGRRGVAGRTRTGCRPKLTEHRHARIDGEEGEGEVELCAAVGPCDQTAAVIDWVCSSSSSRCMPSSASNSSAPVVVTATLAAPANVLFAATWKDALSASPTVSGATTPLRVA